MAYNDIEVEIKLSVSEDEFFGARNKLKQIAKFVLKAREEDEYFTPRHKDFMDVKYPFEWLRIRKRGDKNIINYKHFYPENTEIFSHCDEFETELTSFEKIRKIFDALDFKSLVIVDKEREIYEYNEEFEIGLDKVNELGFFIEIEALKDFGSVEKTREKLFEFAKMLGLDITKTLNKGYPYLLMEKKGLF